VEFYFAVRFQLPARFFGGFRRFQRFFMPIRCFRLSCVGSTKMENLSLFAEFMKFSLENSGL
jgi:hypothetical protein